MVYQNLLTTINQSTYIGFRTNHLNQGTHFLRIEENGKQIQTKRVLKR